MSIGFFDFFKLFFVPVPLPAASPTSAPAFTHTLPMEAISIMKTIHSARTVHAPRTRARRVPRPAPAPLALPADVTRGEPRITLYADERAFIENHSGIIEFDNAHVRVAARRLALTVRGEQLALDCCEHCALIVRGRILAVELEPRGGAL